MSWSNELMASLDKRASIVPTTRGAVQLAREGRGPPVLAFHGGPGGFDMGLAWCRHLSDGGCEVIAPSRPGYLRTPLQSGRSVASQADLCAAMLDTLAIERTAVVGFSSGGPPAVHFAARYPERTTALLLDTAILLPFQPPISALQRKTFESAFFVWVAHRMVMKRPSLMAGFVVNGVSSGLDKEQRRAAVEWITSDPWRLHTMQEHFAAMAPRSYRQPGWINDQANEVGLTPLPFADVTAPTLIAIGASDAIVPIKHATHAADRIAGAKLFLVEEGHHILSLSRNYTPVAQRQLELIHG